MRRRVYKRKIQMEDGSDYKRASANWDKWRKLWEAQREMDNEDWQSNHIVPLIPSVVETALAEMVDQHTEVFIKARGQEDAPKATVMTNIWDYSWDVSHSEVAKHDILKDALICGTAIGEEKYLRMPRKIRYYVRNSKGELEEKEETVNDYDDVVLEPVKLEDFRVDETARGFFGPNAARDCMRRFIQDVEDVKAYFSQPGWNELAKNLEYLKPGGDLDYYEFYRPPQGIDRSRQCEVWWYWSKFPDDWLTVVANDVVIYMGPNFYKHKNLPFVRCIDVKRTHSFYHKGEPEILESIQDEKNTIRRMGIDRSHLDIDKMFLASTRLQLSDEDLMARPHGLIPVDDITQIKPVEYSDNLQSTKLSLEKLDEDAILATGIDPRLSALPQGGTATEAAIVKESALKRIRLKLQYLENEFMNEVAKLRVSNIIQFYSQPKLEKILGDQGSVLLGSEIGRLKQQNLLLEKDGEMYRKKYRTMRLTDKELVPNVKGQIEERPIKGDSFFEMQPEFFVPLAKEGFDIKIKSGSGMPVSKALSQTKAAELYDRLIQNPNYSPVKLGDWLLEENDKDPESLHAEQDMQANDGEQRLQQLIDLAMQENKMMTAGQEVPPTQMSSPAHTRIHIEYLRSNQVPADQKIVQIFSDHVTGELLDQEQRKSAGAGASEQPGDMMAGGETPQGGGMMTSVQSGEGLRRGVSGKVKKPQLSMGDLMPQMVTGVNNLPVQA